MQGTAPVIRNTCRSDADPPLYGPRNCGVSHSPQTSTLLRRNQLVGGVVDEEPVDAQSNVRGI